MVKSCASEMRAGASLRLPLIRNRERFLEELCSRHKNVAHLGSADSPYTAERLANGALLHSRLVKTSRVVGFDVDSDALAMLRKAMPDDAFECLDVTEPVGSRFAKAFDLVLAGEVLEHVSDIGRFLAGCRQLLSDDGLLCVTVPNACSPKIGIRALIGRESVHPDHFVYFGPRTLTRTLVAAGFTVRLMASYHAQTGTLGKILYPVLSLSHFLFQGPIGEGLIALAS